VPFSSQSRQADNLPLDEWIWHCNRTQVFADCVDKSALAQFLQFVPSPTNDETIVVGMLTTANEQRVATLAK
jgi:hypothetical protein